MSNEAIEYAKRHFDFAPHTEFHSVEDVVNEAHKSMTRSTFEPVAAMLLTRLLLNFKCSFTRATEPKIEIHPIEPTCNAVRVVALGGDKYAVTIECVDEDKLDGLQAMARRMLKAMARRMLKAAHS